MKHLKTVESRRGHKSKDYIISLSESEFEVLRALVSRITMSTYFKPKTHKSTYINLRRSIINTKKTK